MPVWRRRLLVTFALASTSAMALGRSSRADAPERTQPAEAVPTEEERAIETPDVEADATPEAAFAEPFFPFLDDEDPSASISIGDVTHGSIVNAKQLAESDACGILPRQKARDLAYGTSEIVAMIEHAAQVFHEKTGTRFWIGDIGRRGGGDIVYSVSHNSGRDADIALAYLDKDNKPVDPPDLVPLDGRGESKTHEYKFDAARTWLIVRTFLEYPGAQVQYMFLSEALKHHLIVYAQTHHEPVDIVARAVDVIHQPGSPHNDHLHLRIYCGTRDLEGGCIDNGVFHDWVKVDRGAKARRVASAVEKLEASEPAVRRNAAFRLAVLDARDHANDVAKRLTDSAPEVRAAAAASLGSIGAPEHADALAATYTVETDLTVKAAILGAERDLGGATAGHVLAKAIGARLPECPNQSFDPFALANVERDDLDSPFPSLRLVSTPCMNELDRDSILRAGIEAAGYADRLEPVDALIDVLAYDAADLRAQAADALGRITNRRFGEDWGSPAMTSADRDRAVTSWRKWADWQKKVPREAWIANGFLAAGFKASRLDSQHVWEIIRALAKGDFLAYNAHKTLVRIAARRPSYVSWSDASACADWLAFFEAHRRQFELEPAPEVTVKACAHPTHD